MQHKQNMQMYAAQRAGRGACDSAAVQGTGAAPVLLYLHPGREGALVQSPGLAAPRLAE